MRELLPQFVIAFEASIIGTHGLLLPYDFCDRSVVSFPDPACSDTMQRSTIPYALAVDDDPLILMDVCGILEDAGFRVQETDNGDTALAMLPIHAENIVLLFSDVEMPGGTNGFALARHVAEQYPWIEIVIASGRIKPKPGDMPEKATFLGKPFTASMVINHLREALPDGKKPEPLKNAI